MSGHEDDLEAFGLGDVATTKADRPISEALNQEFRLGVRRPDRAADLAFFEELKSLILYGWNDQSVAHVAWTEAPPIRPFERLLPVGEVTRPTDQVWYGGRWHDVPGYFRIGSKYVAVKRLSL